MRKEILCPPLKEESNLYFCLSCEGILSIPHSCRRKTAHGSTVRQCSLHRSAHHRCGDCIKIFFSLTREEVSIHTSPLALSCCAARFISRVFVAYPAREIFPYNLLAGGKPLSRRCLTPTNIDVLVSRRARMPESDLHRHSCLSMLNRRIGFRLLLRFSYSLLI
jgi:hypothetical protein